VTVRAVQRTPSSTRVGHHRTAIACNASACGRRCHDPVIDVSGHAHMASSTGSASSVRQIRKSGSQASRWL
jgi:hypothetical protein